MRPHHTKDRTKSGPKGCGDKGDVGVAHAIADLADQGFVVLTEARTPGRSTNKRSMLFASTARDRACYYVDPKAFGVSVSLRIRPSRNNQSRNVLTAAQHRDVPHLG